MNIKVIFAVMNITQAVVKIRPKKNLGLYIIWIYDQYNDRENLIFFLFSSLIWLILYRYRKEIFCLGHSWELKVKLKSIMFPQGPPGECRGKLWLCSWSQFHQKKNRFLWSCVTFAKKLGIFRDVLFGQGFATNYMILCSGFQGIPNHKLDLQQVAWKVKPSGVLDWVFPIILSFNNFPGCVD